MPAKIGAVPVLQDTAFYVALIMALFTIAFGTRHLDAAERHEGMVAAIAFESIVKLVAFLAVGVFVTFGIYDGFGDVFARAAAARSSPRCSPPLEGVAGSYASWVWLTILSMLAIMFLPRQFQVAVIENVDEQHLQKAIWLFPALHAGDQRLRAADRLRRPAAFPDGTVDADTFVLTLPMAEKQEPRAARLHRRAVGGDRHGDRRDDRAVDDGVQRPRDAGAAAPARLRLTERPDLTGLLLDIRRGAIVLVLLLGYLYFRSPARPMRWSRSGSSPSPRSPSSRRRSSAASSGRAPRGAARWRALSPASRSGPTRCCCRRSRNRDGCPSRCSSTARSGSSC